MPAMSTKNYHWRIAGFYFFYYDQQKHCESARQHVATGHVPHGVANE